MTVPLFHPLFREREREPTLRAISLGAGVQSTVMALLADRGTYGVKPDCAIFADTKWEPSGVYKTLEWVKDQLSFPVYVVSNGRSLKQDVIDGVQQNGLDYITIPVFTIIDGKEGFASQRQCTSRYKIEPIQNKIRELLGVKKGKIPRGILVEQWMGISTDEASRMKPSRVKWLRNRYPLIEWSPMNRRECRKWFHENYSGITLSRSACVGCPYRSPSRWLEVRKDDPDMFEEAIDIDASLRDHRKSKTFGGEAFLHRRRIPLKEAVDADYEEYGARIDRANKIDDSFINECEGHCGV